MCLGCCLGIIVCGMVLCNHQITSTGAGNRCGGRLRWDCGVLLWSRCVLGSQL